MKIIDKYILNKILTTFFFVVLILVAIVSVIDLTEKMDKYSRNNLDALTILSYYGDFIPWIAGLITPITVFIAIVFVTSQMAARTEIIAILGSGVSFVRMLFPYFIGALILAVISFYLNGWIIPKSNLSRLDFEMRYLNKNANYDKQNVHMQVEPNVYLYLQNYNNQSNIGYQFTLERFNENNQLLEKLTADNIQWDSTINKWTLRQWKRRKVDSLFLVKNSSDLKHLVESGTAKDTTLAILPKDFTKMQSNYDGLTIPELGEQIAKMKFRGATGVEIFQTERHIRFASPFTIFVLVFMGVIVSARKSRGGTGFQIALGFLLSFVFILFFMMTRTFAEAGSLSPWMAAWLPNASFAVIALGMYKFVPR
ncbi:MAG TPA: LptF/LptG family permease [Cyclobacteriaceae bacterium]